MSKIVPCGHRLLIKVQTLEEKTQSGIILTQQFHESENLMQEFGIVVAIGPTAFEGGMGGADLWDINVGDTVFFTRYGGKVLPKFKGYDDGIHGLMRIVNDEDIIAKVEEEH